MQAHTQWQSGGDQGCLVSTTGGTFTGTGSNLDKEVSRAGCSATLNVRLPASGALIHQLLLRNPLAYAWHLHVLPSSYQRASSYTLEAPPYSLCVRPCRHSCGAESCAPDILILHPHPFKSAFEQRGSYEFTSAFHICETSALFRHHLLLRAHLTLYA